MAKRPPPQIDWDAMQPGQTGWYVEAYRDGWRVHPQFQYDEDHDELGDGTAPGPVH